MQADLLRGFKPDGVTPAPGRRVLAQPLHDAIAQNPPPTNIAPAGAVQWPRMVRSQQSFPHAAR